MAKFWACIILVFLSYSDGHNLPDLKSGDSKGLKSVNDYFCKTQNPCYNDPEPLGCFPLNYGGPFCHMVDAPEDPRTIEAQFMLYTPQFGINPVQIIQFYDGLLRPSIQTLQLNNSKPLWVIVHGFLGDWPKTWMFPMKDALLAKGNNVLLVRWTKGSAGPNYFQATANTRVVGKMVARVLTVMQEETNLSFNQVTIVGFSLGAHVAGFAGDALNGQIRRIIGLDPAGPFFAHFQPQTRLDSSDAQYVQAIHCNGDVLTNGGFGTMEAMGHTDFYANGGKHQPGCPPASKVEGSSILHFNYTAIFAVACSHGRCPWLFTTSILDSHADSQCQYKAYPCSGSDDWIEGNCFTCNPKLGCVAPGYSVDLGTKFLDTSFFGTRADNMTSSYYCGQQYKLEIITMTSLKAGDGNVKVTFFYSGANPPRSKQVDYITETDSLSYLASYSRILVAPPDFTRLEAIELLYIPKISKGSSPPRTIGVISALLKNSKGNQGQMHAIPGFQMRANQVEIINVNL